MWNDPRLLALHPIFALSTKVFPQAGAFNAPWNTRTDEIFKAVDTALKPMWDGKASVRDTARTAREAVDVILSQPG